MKGLANKIQSTLTKSLLQSGFSRLKQNSVVKALKDIKKIKRGSNYDSIASGLSSSNGNETNRALKDGYDSKGSSTPSVNSRYVSIRPLEDLYTSVKIINGEKHNLQGEKEMKNKLKLAENDEKIDNEAFLEKWMTSAHKQVIMVENYPLSDLAFKSIESHGAEALKIIEESSFLQFRGVILRKKKNWDNFQDTMQPRKHSLSNSLTYLSPQLEEYALEMFDLVLSCQGLKHTEHPYYYNACKLMNFVARQNNDQLNQELYLQLIKQNQNTSLIYLRLLALASCIIKPSLRLYIPLLNYLRQEAKKHEQYKEFYSFTFFHLIKNFDNPRRFGCSIFEAQMLMHLRKIAIIFDLPTPKTFFVESYTTIRQFFDMAIQFFNLDPDLDYLLYCRGSLLRDGILLDGLTRSDLHSDIVQTYEQFMGYRVLMVLKNMRRMKTSNKSFNLMYHYFVQQHLKNYYYLTKEDNIKVAALKLYSQMEDQECAVIETQKLLPNSYCRRYIYKSIDSKVAEIHTIRRIMEQYDAINTLTKINARKRLLSTLQKRQNFMTHFFRGKVYLEEEEDDLDAILGVKPNKLLLVDYESGRYIRKVPYDKIVKYGKSNSEFCFVLETIGEIHFQTPYAALVSELVQQYITDLVKLNA